MRISLSLQQASTSAAVTNETAKLLLKDFLKNSNVFKKFFVARGNYITTKVQLKPQEVQEVELKSKLLGGPRRIL